MPANLPPQYFEAEKSFRLAKRPEEKIAALEEMLAIMPKHKGTDHLRGSAIYLYGLTPCWSWWT